MVLDVQQYSGVTADSRRVRADFIYVALRGTKHDGHCYIDAALDAGASVIVCERVPEERCPGGCYIEVEDSRTELNRLLREFYGNPDEKLKLFGVTGTNGKTTTAYLVHDFLSRAGISAGLISTVEFHTPRTAIPATHTTPDPETFYQLLSRCVGEGALALAMELSSHALAQHRVDGVRFQSAVFTNLTGDHLDYHKTFENYFAAKKRLFFELLAEDGTAVINIDDSYGRALAEELHGVRSVVTFGTAADADCRISEIRLAATGSCCVIEYRGQRESLQTILAGEHNLHNIVGAMLGAEALGCNWHDLMQFAASPRAVPGRLEKVEMPDCVTFLIDYAHTDDALRQVLTALRPLTTGNVICVFGCGGDRDRTKRPRMGRVASELSDLAILTSDNPRSEDPDAIIADVLAGIGEDAKVLVEPDRAVAIRLAYERAVSGDLVLIAGKGHEDYQEIKGVKSHFSDRECVLALQAKC